MQASAATLRQSLDAYCHYVVQGLPLVLQQRLAHEQQQDLLAALNPNNATTLCSQPLHTTLLLLLLLGG